MRSLSSSIFFQKDDYQSLLAAGGDDAEAAVDMLQARGGAILLVADKPFLKELEDSALYQFQNLAQDEQDPSRQCDFAAASAEIHAVQLLPWLAMLANSPQIAEGSYTMYHPTFGAAEQLYLCDILRAVGYLVRVLLDDEQKDKTHTAVTTLHEYYATLQPNEERSIVVGLTTGLGYLGEWKPILTHLGPGEPWMHEAARNVFRHWVPSPLVEEEPSAEYRRGRYLS